VLNGVDPVVSFSSGVNVAYMPQTWDTKGGSLTVCETDNGDDKLVMQDDGNLVHYRYNAMGVGTAIWSSCTGQYSPTVCRLETDGTLALSDINLLLVVRIGNAFGEGACHIDFDTDYNCFCVKNNKDISATLLKNTWDATGRLIVVCETSEDDQTGDKLIMQPDGNLVHYRYDSTGSKSPIWSSNTVDYAATVCRFEANGTVNLYSETDALVNTFDSPKAILGPTTDDVSGHCYVAYNTTTKYFCTYVSTGPEDAPVVTELTDGVLIHSS